MRKKCSSDWEIFLKSEAEGRKICKNFEITRTIYSNSERPEQLFIFLDKSYGRFPLGTYFSWSVRTEPRLCFSIWKLSVLFVILDDFVFDGSTKANSNVSSIGFLKKNKVANGLGIQS